MMTRAKQIYYVAISLTTVALVAGFVLTDADLRWGIPAVLAVAAAWLWGESRGWAWIASLGLALILSMAALGVLFAMAPGWAIVATAAGLVGWDIGRFNRLLAGVKRIDEAETLERRYLRRLLTVTGLGAAVAGMTTLIQLQFGFTIALLLGFISIIGFSRAIGYLRYESD